MTPGDIIGDYDALANALAGIDPANHEHSAVVKKVTKAARDAAIREAQKHTQDVDVLVIHSTPAASTLDRYRREGADIIVVDPGKDIVMHRIKHERPGHMHAIAAKWYQQQAENNSKTKPKQKPAHLRGYDHRHRRNRDRLLYNLTDGTPCPFCGKPMYKDAHKNFDNAPLEADHTKSLKHHGPSQADRLLHRHCNRSRKDGHDERSPLLNPSREAGQGDATQSGETIGWDWLR